MKKTLRIPSVDFWTREEFLEARRLQHEAALERNKKNDEKDPVTGWDEYIAPIPGDDEIICDSCNAEISDNGELINLVRFGSHVVCDPCYQRWYAGEPIRYKTITIGEEDET